MSGGTHDLSSTASTQGAAQAEGTWRHLVVGLEVHSPEGGKSVPCPLQCSHLCIPSSEQFQNLGELSRPPQHEAGQFLVVRTFSFARTQDRKLRVRHMGPLRNANAGLKAMGSHGRLKWESDQIRLIRKNVFSKCLLCAGTAEQVTCRVLFSHTDSDHASHLTDGDPEPWRRFNRLAL